MVRVNRVRRIIRKIDPWTVLKVTFVLNFVVALTVILGMSILWVLLVNAGVPQGLEDIARRLALLDQDASLVSNVETLFTGVVSMAILYMLVQTALATIGAFFYNLVSDIVGGIEVVVLEETHVDPTIPPQKKVNKTSSTKDKETVLTSLVNSAKKARKTKSEVIDSVEDLPRPDVPRNIEEPTLMDSLKNSENEDEDFS